LRAGRDGDLSVRPIEIEAGESERVKEDSSDEEVEVEGIPGERLRLPCLNFNRSYGQVTITSSPQKRASTLTCR
jgi:hypothetical protein